MIVILLISLSIFQLQHNVFHINIHLYAPFHPSSVIYSWSHSDTHHPSPTGHWKANSSTRIHFVSDWLRCVWGCELFELKLFSAASKNYFTLLWCLIWTL